MIKEVQDHLSHSAGTLAVRRRLADAAMSGLTKIAEDPAGGSDVALARVMAQERLGELSFLAGRTDAARRHHQAGRDQAEALAARVDGAIAVEARRLGALCLDRLGDLALYAGDLKEAGVSYRRALALRKSLPDPDREGPEGLRSRAVSHTKLGDVALRSGRLEEARSAYQRGLALTEVDRDPDAQRHRFDLRFAHSRLGDVALARCDFDAADREYRRALEYAEAQLAADPADVRARREVPVCYSKLGALALRRADPPGLSSSTGNTSTARRPLPRPIPPAPRPAATCWSLSAWWPIPNSPHETTRPPSDPIADASVSPIPSRGTTPARCKNAWTLASCSQSSPTWRRRGRFEEAADWLEQARANLGETAGAGLITPAGRTELDAALAYHQGVCRQARRALADPAWIATRPPKLARGLWAIRSMTLARRGDVRAAVEAAETLRRLAPDDVDCLLIVARAHCAVP